MNEIERLVSRATSLLGEAARSVGPGPPARSKPPTLWKLSARWEQ